MGISTVELKQRITGEVTLLGGRMVHWSMLVRKRLSGQGLSKRCNVIANDN